MGLITGLLTLPLAPVRGVGWIAGVLGEEADRVLAEQSSPRRRLADIDAMRARGEITAEEADAMETEVIDAVLAAQDWDAPDAART